MNPVTIQNLNIKLSLTTVALFGHAEEYLHGYILGVIIDKTQAITEAEGEVLHALMQGVPAFFEVLQDDKVPDVVSTETAHYFITMRLGAKKSGEIEVIVKAKI